MYVTRTSLFLSLNYDVKLPRSYTWLQQIARFNGEDKKNPQNKSLFLQFDYFQILWLIFDFSTSSWLSIVLIFRQRFLKRNKIFLLKTFLLSYRPYCQSWINSRRWKLVSRYSFHLFWLSILKGLIFPYLFTVLCSKNEEFERNFLVRAKGCPLSNCTPVFSRSERGEC